MGKLYERTQKVSSVGLTLVLLAATFAIACAVQRGKAPQLDTETVWRLNTAAQLQQAERDYRTLFTDVGVAKRAGTLTDSQVNQLNAIGDRAKPAIEEANRLWKAYVASPSTDKKTQIINAVLEVERILLELSTKKAQIMTGGGGQ